MGRRASELLSAASDLPLLEAERMLLAATGKSRSWLVGNPEVDDPSAASYAAMLERRRNGEPLQYIEGSASFGPLEVAVDGRVLIPRPETELLWEIALLHLHGVDNPVVIDLCTGSGNLALAVKKERPDARVLATDLSASALAVAEANRAAHWLDVELLEGDLFVPVPEELRRGVDLIVANPPYVSEAEYAVLPDEVKDHEPKIALVSSEEGMGLLNRIAADAIDWLCPGGWVICEIGETQGEAVLESFAPYEPEILSDLAGRDRFVLGRAPMVADVH